MSVRDSSLTRAKPVFDQVLSIDPTGRRWLRELLFLPHFHGSRVPLDLSSTSGLIEWKWGEEEKRLKPPRSLLTWLVQNPPPALAEDSDVSEGTRQDRRALLEGDPETVEKALNLLAHKVIPDREWYVFEGITQPDVYLETLELAVAIEAKRTELGPTTCTKWMPVRHQMLRHLDAAWEVVRPKRLFGFFIVEGMGDASAVEVPEHWLQAIADMVSENAVVGSLPHRSSEEREQIVEVLSRRDDLAGCVQGFRNQLGRTPRYHC